MARRTLAIEVTFETITCCHIGCGITFAVPDWWNQKRRDDHAQWYCPNGHPQGYFGPSKQEAEAEKLREQLEQAQRDLKWQDQQRMRLANDNMDLANSNRALKGVATKLKKRVTAGLCSFCNRSFSNVRAHMIGQHPDQCADGGTPATKADQEALTKTQRGEQGRGLGESSGHQDRSE